MCVMAGSTFVIDPEFAFYGPMGFDTGEPIRHSTCLCTDVNVVESEISLVGEMPLKDCES